MSLNLTEEQILKLAPDASSEKAGKGLATQSKWVLRVCNDRVLWGHCQGSGKNPYQTAIDLNNIAFKCSCPSHKFPCKHGLGLLLLYAAQPQLFGQEDEPDWVTDWLAKREQKAEKKIQTEQQNSEKPVDEVAQTKRLEARHKKVTGGIEELQIWLKDMVRNGLLNIPERAHTLFEGVARRMVDAQAPGLAGMVHRLQEIDYYRDEWKYELTERLSKIWLLTESYKRLEQLPDDWQQEIKNLIGFVQPKEDVFAGEPVKDEWLVLGTDSRRQDRITVDYNWLWGRQTGRKALFIQFIAPGALPEFNLLPGSVFKGEVFYYKGIAPLRGLLKQSGITDETVMPPACDGLTQAFKAYRNEVCLNPFVEDVPLLVSGIRLVCEGNNWWITDEEGKIVRVVLNESGKMKILAVTGGKSFTGFLSGNTLAWTLRSVWVDGKYYFLRNDESDR